MTDPAADAVKVGPAAGVPAPADDAPVPIAEPVELDVPAPPSFIDPPPEPAAEGSAVTPAAPEVPLVRVLVSPSASRRLAESLIIFIGAILFLRAAAVEPFGVPTGSMAPTLIGNHKVTNCPRCQYVIRVGEVSRPNGAPTSVTCPNCGRHGIDLGRAMEIAGDRLLVDKNVYTLRRPRRWEPAVFRCPSDMTKPYVKRVVGLPAERILIVDGDIRINGKLARKTLAECREARVAVFDLGFPPQPDGWIKRWAAESNLPGPEKGPELPESPFALGERDLRLDGSWAAGTPMWVAYRHHAIDEATGEEREEVLRDAFVYNGSAGDDKALPVHDFSVEFEVEVVGGAGAILLRLSDGKDQVAVSCPVGAATDEAALRHEGFGVVRTAKRKPLEAGKKYRVEMAFVDRRVSFAVDRREPFAAYDLDQVEGRADVVSPLAVGVQGANVIVRDLRIYRDIYYRSSGRNAVDAEHHLGPDEYFMLGDNSANSDDSRSWLIPGVPERNFLGKPFLLHQPSRVTHLTVGGRERVFQSIDWGRIRFLR